MLIKLTALQGEILLALQSGKNYGLGLIEKFNREEKKFWFLTARIYPALRNLERHGLVESSFGDACIERGWRPRVYYTLTREGFAVADARNMFKDNLFQA